MTEPIIKVPGMFLADAHNVPLAKTSDIFDDNNELYQDQINRDLYNSLSGKVDSESIKNAKDVLSFDLIIDSDILDIQPSTENKPTSIVYSSYRKKFIAAVTVPGTLGATYYYVWPNYEQYVDTAKNNSPYDSKVYLCGSKTYVWNGIDLVAGGGQVQANWTQEDSTQPDYIKNKPASAISGRIWINAGNSSADIINDSSLHLNYVYGTPLQITADNNKLILVYTINVELPLKMYVGGVEIPYDKSTGAGYHVLTSKNNYTGIVEVVVKQ